ncbi:MAG: hypothetical protein HFH06_04465 [Lachnospiraceae bacterium]|nr:hypothetical protein [Lachnospiraceae bacterium]
MVSEQQILPASTHFPTLIGISVREITKPEKTAPSDFTLCIAKLFHKLLKQLEESQQRFFRICTDSLIVYAADGGMTGSLEVYIQILTGMCADLFISGKTPQNIFLKVPLHKHRRSGGCVEAWGVVLSGK